MYLERLNKLKGTNNNELTSITSSEVRNERNLSVKKGVTFVSANSTWEEYMRAANMNWIARVNYMYIMYIPFMGKAWKGDDVTLH